LRHLFFSCLRPLNVFDHELAPEHFADPSAFHGFHIVPAIKHGTPIFINRDLPRRGYWDHPVSRVQPDEVELDLLHFFDFDKLGYRDYRYFEVVVHASTKFPDIVGRAALIEVQRVRVLFSKKPA
jgi:hypothetical protein